MTTLWVHACKVVTTVCVCCVHASKVVTTYSELNFPFIQDGDYLLSMPYEHIVSILAAVTSKLVRSVSNILEKHHNLALDTHTCDYLENTFFKHTML